MNDSPLAAAQTKPDRKGRPPGAGWIGLAMIVLGVFGALRHSRLHRDAMDCRDEPIFPREGMPPLDTDCSGQCWRM
nr:hypothetical protein [Kibdelosporangium sp. MJ126-NF4]